MIEVSLCGTPQQGCVSAHARGGMGEILLGLGVVVGIALFVVVVFRPQVLHNIVARLFAAP